MPVRSVFGYADTFGRCCRNCPQKTSLQLFCSWYYTQFRLCCQHPLHECHVVRNSFVNIYCFSLKKNTPYGKMRLKKTVNGGNLYAARAEHNRSCFNRSRVHSFVPYLGAANQCNYTCSDVCGSNHPAWDMQKNACQTSNRHWQITNQQWCFFWWRQQVGAFTPPSSAARRMIHSKLKRNQRTKDWCHEK